MKKVFIDGSAGTTGLRIAERLENRKDLQLIRLTEERRKLPEARKEALAEADVAFLCLPDDAARETVSLAEGLDTVIIDTSTAHRTAAGWTYGFPEIGNRYEAIAKSSRIANPGCHASGFIALAAPLVEQGLLAPDTQLSATSLTGYSGGGKKMIAEYEQPEPDPLYAGPRFYGLSQKHKHLPEMSLVAGLTAAPLFCPVVADYYAGMEVIIPLSRTQLKGSLEDVREVYRSYYTKGLVHFAENCDEGGFLSAAAFAGRDDMEVCVYGNEERITLISRFDNLGKGASGAAIQNMNIRLGLPESEGLVL